MPIPLPNELLIRILEALDGRTIVQLREVEKRFNIVITYTISLQYLVRLSMAGYIMMTATPNQPVPSLSTRLGPLMRHVDAWRHLEWDPFIYTLPDGADILDETVVQGIYAYSDTIQGTGRITLVVLPSRLYNRRDVRVRTYSYVRRILAFTLDPRQDLLVVLMLVPSNELAVYFLKLSDNAPHPFATSPAINTGVIREWGSLTFSVQIMGSLVGIMSRALAQDQDDYVEGVFMIYHWHWGTRPLIKSLHPNFTSFRFITIYREWAEIIVTEARPNGPCDVIHVHPFSLNPALPQAEGFPNSIDYFLPSSKDGNLVPDVDSFNIHGVPSALPLGLGMPTRIQTLLTTPPLMATNPLLNMLLVHWELNIGSRVRPYDILVPTHVFLPSWRARFAPNATEIPFPVWGERFTRPLPDTYPRRVALGEATQSSATVGTRTGLIGEAASIEVLDFSPGREVWDRGRDVVQTQSTLSLIADGATPAPMYTRPRFPGNHHSFLGYLHTARNVTFPGGDLPALYMSDEEHIVFISEDDKGTHVMILTF